MANFDIAYALTKKFEGGYSDVAGDTGGVTYAGITRKNFPTWAGWPIVASKPRRHNEHIPELDTLVKEFYRVNFWNKVQGDSIVDQDFANDLFDMAVNAGTGAAIKLAQRTVGVAETGKLTTDTINLINGIV